MYLLMRNPDVSRHHAAHGSHVSRRRADDTASRVLHISRGVALFRERLAAIPVQDVVTGIRFT